MKTALFLTFLLTSVARTQETASAPGASYADEILLINALVAGSEWDRAFSAVEKAGRLPALVERMQPGAAPPVSPAGGRSDRTVVPLALLLERTGRAGEARAALESVPALERGSTAAAWHLARLGNPAPLHQQAGKIQGEDLRPLLEVMVSEPDAAKRGEFRALLERQLAEFPESAVRGQTLCALAEFAFQEGRLAEFVAAAEAGAEQASGEAGAERCLSVSRLHAYLFNAAKSRVWQAKAMALNPKAPEFWNALAALLAGPAGYNARPGESPEGIAALYEKALSHEALPNALRQRVIGSWLETDGKTCAAWLSAHDTDLASVASGIVTETLREDKLPTAELLPVVEQACRKTPDVLELHLLWSRCLTKQMRTAEAAAALQQTFVAAGEAWMKASGGQPDVLLRPLEAIQPFQLNWDRGRKADATPVERAAWIRARAWQEWRRSAGSAALLAVVREKGPALFLSPDEELIRLMEGECWRLFWEKLAAWLAGTPDKLPELVINEAAERLNQTFRSRVLSPADSARLVRLAETMGRRWSALPQPAYPVGRLLEIIYSRGDRELAVKIAEEVKEKARQLPEKPEWRGFADQALKIVRLPPLSPPEPKPETKATLTPVPVPVPAAAAAAAPDKDQARRAALSSAAALAPLRPPLCGRWFHEFPFPDSVSRYTLKGGFVTPVRWKGRYGTPPGRWQFLAESSGRGMPPGLTPEQNLRWHLALDRIAGGLPSPDSLQPVVAPLLASAPNDDLRLIFAQCVLERTGDIVNEFSAEALKHLDSVTTTDGVYSLITAGLRSQFLMLSQKPDEARQALTVFTERGYRLAADPRPSKPGDPENLILAIKERRPGAPAAEVVSRFLRLVSQKIDGYTVGELLIAAGKDGWLEAADKAAREEMRNSPQGTEIAVNLYEGYRQTEDYRPLPEKQAKRYLPFAEFLAEKGAADENMLYVLTQHYRESQPEKALSLVADALVRNPSLGPGHCTTGPLARELHDSGRLETVVAARAAWFRNPERKEREGTVRDFWTGWYGFLGQLAEFPEGKVHLRTLLSASSASGEKSPDAGTLAAAVPIFIAAGAEADLQVFARRALLPALAAEPATSDPDFLPLEAVRPRDAELWAAASAKKKPPVIVLLETIRNLGGLEDLRKLLEGQATGNPAPDSALMLAARLLAEPAKAKEHYLSFRLTNQEILPALFELPGFTRELVIRTEAELLPGDAGSGSGRTGPWNTTQLAIEALKLGETSADTALMKTILKAAADAVIAREIKGPAHYLSQPSFIEQCIREMLLREMGDEAAGLYEASETVLAKTPTEAFPLIAAIHGHAVRARHSGIEEKTAAALTALLPALETSGGVSQWYETGPILAFAENRIAAAKFSDARAILKLLKTPQGRDPRRDILQMRLEFEEGKDGGFVTWPSVDDKGTLQLGWHTRTYSVPGFSGAGTPGWTVTWDPGHRDAGEKRDLTILSSPDGKLWKEGPATVLLTVSGAVAMPGEGFIRTLVRTSAGISLGDPVPAGRVVLAGQDSLPSQVFLNDPATGKSGPGKVLEWQPLSAADGPGSSSRTVEAEIDPSRDTFIATPALEWTGRRGPRLSGWIKVEGEASVGIAVQASEKQAPSFQRTSAYPPAGGGWVLIPPQTREGITPKQVRIVISLTPLSTGRARSEGPVRIRLSCSDLLLTAP